MTSVVLALVWLTAVGTALAACSVFERRARVGARDDRPELLPPRQFWGGARREPPAASAIARGLADFARLVRSENRVEGHRPGLRMLGRVGIVFALATGLAMIPIAGAWGGGPSGEALVPLDLRSGLAALGLLFLLLALARVATALSEPSPWSRLGGARQASRAIAALAVLTLVLAPLAVDAGSLRLHEIVLDQQRPIAVLDWLLASGSSPFFETLRAWPWPAWNLFTQPITAILFVPTISLLLASPRVDDPATGSVGIAGIGLDGDVADHYWTRLDTRLSSILSAALFVALFLGAGSIPFVDAAAVVPLLSPFVGEFLSMLLLSGIHVAVFMTKWLILLGIVARSRRLVTSSRDDRALRFTTRRLLPLAWANLLLVTAVTLWFDARAGGLG